MVQAFVVVFREAFEAFLIVAITVAYLRRTNQSHLLGAVAWGIGVSILTSALLGYAMKFQANEALWEGIFGFIGAVLVAWLVIHMWRTAPRLKREMEGRLAKATTVRSSALAQWGVFLFTTLMITREGMETVLLLIQIHDARIILGIFLGLAGAAALGWMWVRVGHLVNLKLFFQVTSVFLLLFVAQILLYSLHEFTEAGIFPQSEWLHEATGPFSSDGVFTRWLTVLMVGTCALWFLSAWGYEKFRDKRRTAEASPIPQELSSEEVSV